MLQFLVLGQIPGTSVQINYYSFLLVVSLFGAIVLTRMYFHSRRQRVLKQAALLLTTL